MPNLIERTPPHNKDAEVAVMGGMLMAPETLSEVIEVIKDASYFYMPAHQLIYKQMCDLFEKGQPIDLVTVGTALQERGLLEKIGGSAYLMALSQSIATTANIGYYADIIKRNAVLRRLIQAGTEIVEMGFDTDTSDIPALINQAEQCVFKIGQGEIGKELKHIQPVLWDIFEELERSYNDPSSLKKKHFNTGFVDLNQHLGGGFSPSDLIILAARPAMGKTAMALNIGTNIALDSKKPAVIFSLEMSKEQLITRILCSESAMNARSLRSGTLHTDEWQNISNAIARLSEAPIYFDDSSNITPAELRAKCTRLKAEHGDLSVIIIDYIQLMETGNAENRVQEISKISRSLKQLARELDVPVLALSQLNRGVEQRTNKRPMLSDLRESGSIEQDADIVFMLYRDEYYNPESNDKNTAELIIAKHRHGPTGTVRLFFDSSITRFGNLMID